MKRLCFTRFVGLVVLAGACLTSGCSSKKLPPMAPVSGKVTVGGQPLTSGQVSLVPDVGIPRPGKEKQNVTPTVGVSAGQINSDGTYTIFTARKEGAPPGQYKFTVTPSTMPVGDGKAAPARDFNQVYSDSRNTPLKFEVVDNPGPGRYDLKLTK